MRLTLIHSLVSLLLLVTPGVWAQSSANAPPPTLPQALVQAVKKAVASNPDVQSKLNGFRAAEGLRGIASSGFLPQIDFSASVGPESRSTPTVPTTAYDTELARLTLNQILFDGFFTASEVQRLSAARRTRYYELQEAAETVALDAVKAYTDVVRFRELVDLARENYAEHKQSATLVEERVRGGAGSRADLEQASGRLALAESNLLTELTNLHDASARYLRVVGEVPPQSLGMLPEPFRLGLLPATSQQLLREGLQSSPTVLAAIQNARSSQFASATARAAFMPRLDLQAYASAGNNNAVAGKNDATGAALALNYNLFKGGADRANQRLSASNAEQARDLQDKACRDVRQVLSVAFSDVRSLNEKLSYEDRHRLSSEKTREAYRQQFEVGQRTLMDLLDTQNEYFQSARSYAIARHDQAAAQARTLAAMGRLVGAMAATRPDMPDESMEDGQDDAGAPCEGIETIVDTVDNIKAGLDFSRPPKPVSAYVVLLPDRDNVVGQVTVEGQGGKQLLSQAQQGVQADGGGSAFAVSDAQLKADFGEVMAALPVAPVSFVLYFQRGSNVLAPESKALLPAIVERAALHPGLDMTIIGHTDTWGSAEVNKVIGLQRAGFVARQLRALGLKANAVAIESAGQNAPEIPTPEDTVERRNRRVEVILR